MREPTLLDRVVAVAYVLGLLLQPLGSLLLFGAGALLWPGRGLDPLVTGLWLGAAGWFLVWAVFCGALDNFVRPILIRRGADLPLLLIFVGVIGGLIALGILGLFVGPVLLAVTYTLFMEWITDPVSDSVA